MLREEVIFSQSTLKVSGQFFTAGKGDAGGEDRLLLESEEPWSSGRPEDVCVGGAEMATGSGMGKIYMDHYLVASITHCCMIL